MAQKFLSYQFKSEDVARQFADQVGEIVASMDFVAPKWVRAAGVMGKREMYQEVFATDHVGVYRDLMARGDLKFVANIQIAAHRNHTQVVVNAFKEAVDAAYVGLGGQLAGQLR